MQRSPISPSAFSLTVVVTALLFSTSAPRAAKANDFASGPPSTRAMTIASLPINFEPNYGQARQAARYIARTGGVEIDLCPGKFGLWLSGKRSHSQVSVSFLGARQDADISPSERRSSETNYLSGQDPAGWRTHIPNFGRITYSNIYSGIDAAFYGNGQELEHDFVVAPGADYRLIRLGFEGASELSLDADGNLRLAVEDGELSFQAPAVYQNGPRGRQSREGRFVLLTKNEIGFAIGDYDRSQPLFIDPALNYSTYLANLSVNVNAIATDSSGNTYVAGMDWSGTYPVTPGAFQSVCSGCSSNEPAIFITKLNASATAQVFSTYLGGSNYNQPSGIAVDEQGNTLVVGWTESEDFPLKNPISNGSFNPGNNGTFGFVSSLSPDGSALNYSSLLGGAGPQGSPTTYTNAVALDGSGNAYISGTTDSPFYPVTAGALNSGTPAYPENIVYVSKISPSGGLVYSSLLGDVSFSPPYGGGPIGVMGIGVDGSGNAYIAGDSGGLWPTTSGAYQTQFLGSASNSNKSPYVTKISADGSTLLYSTFIGVDAGVTGIALDSSGDAFVAGSYAPSTFPTTPKAYQPTLASGQTAPFLCELNPSGSELLYSTFFYGTPGSTTVSGVALDASRDIWLSGFTEDPQFPLVHPLETTPASLENGTGIAAGFLSEFNPAGTSLLFSTYFAGQASAANIAGLAIDTSGNVHIAGTVGDDLYTTQGVYLGTVTPPPPNVQYTYGFVAAINPTAAAPAACITPQGSQQIYFGAVPVGTTSSQSVTVENCGTQSLSVSSVQSSSPVYTVPAATNQCSGGVAPGSTCTLSVSFTPTQAQSYPALLTLVSNAPMPTSLTVQGQGAVPVISVSGNNVTFAPTLVGVTSPQVMLTVGNNGQAPLIVNLAATTITPPFAFTASGCSSPILGMPPCVLNLTITPTSAGNFTGTLSIASNDLVTPVYIVSLSGTGLSSYPAPTITGISPQTVAIGSSGVQFSVYGQNFFPNSIIVVKGDALATTYQDSTFLYATLDPALLGSMAELPVTVTNPAPGGGASAPVLLTTYLSVPMQLSSMVYEPYSRVIFASIPASATSNPNTVIALNPQTGAVGAKVAVDKDPGALAVSDDGQYLYVASNGQNAIQRINLTTLAVEKTFSLPVDSMWGSLQASQLAVVPGSSQTVVAVLYIRA